MSPVITCHQHWKGRLKNGIFLLLMSFFLQTEGRDLPTQPQLSLRMMT